MLLQTPMAPPDEEEFDDTEEETDVQPNEVGKKPLLPGQECQISTITKKGRGIGSSELDKQPDSN